jgi:uncharacterized protein
MVGVPLGEFSIAAWCGLALAGGLIGVAKTAISGVGSVAIVIFAVVFPARESTGAVLPLLLCGDVVAVAYYRRHADWAILGRLLPGVLPGLLLGVAFLAVADDAVTRKSIAVILLAMCAIQLWQRSRSNSLDARRSPAHDRRGVLSVTTGATAGFATMTANAAGPVTTLYLLMARLPKLQMLGTGAWFYLTVNLAKVPLSASLGLITPASLVLDAALIPAMLLGAVCGIGLIRGMGQARFELLALTFSAASALLLLL